MPSRGLRKIRPVSSEDEDEEAQLQALLEEGEPASSTNRKPSSSASSDEEDEEAALLALLEQEDGSPKRKRRRADSASETGGSDSETTDSEDDPEASSEESERDEPAGRGAIRRLKAREVLLDLQDLAPAGTSAKLAATAAPPRPLEPVPLPGGFEIRAQLATHMQPHQVSGVKFMFDHMSHSRGCILAHCMGLGKTLQALALIDSMVLREPLATGSEGCRSETAADASGIRTVLIVCPVNVIENWYVEWSKWLGSGANHAAYLLKDAGPNTAKRARLLSEWQKHGGMLVCGYEQFRNLTSGKLKDSPHQATIRESLISPGPDVVVCDEGHVLRNTSSGISKALSQVSTKRRVILTGTPMQNNLLEYHCMVDFASPGQLGSRGDFTSQFVSQITSGQSYDATEEMKKVMRAKLFAMDQLLSNCVNRADLKTLAEYLPPKHEFAVSVRLSPLQENLYRCFLKTAAASSSKENKGDQEGLFTAYHSLAQVWTHPGVLSMAYAATEEREIKAYESIDDFVVVSSDEEWSDDCPSDEFNDSDGARKRKRSTKRKDKAKGSNKKVAKSKSRPSHRSTSMDWWHGMVDIDTQANDPSASGKLVLLLELLKEAAAAQEKMLLFSQSLVVLELIEQILNKSGRWTLGVDYFRLDGSTATKTRQGWVERFNDPNHKRARLFLISTKAGGLGVNLTAASRVVIFDAAWNPSLDTQAVFRAFRFGQDKPVFVYRLLAAGTMEEKIYKRQTSKNKLAAAVLDSQKTAAVVMKEDLEAKELFSFTPSSAGLTHEDRPSSDPVLCRILDKLPEWIVKIEDHDVMADDHDELTEQEKTEAQQDAKHYQQGTRSRRQDHSHKKEKKEKKGKKEKKDKKEKKEKKEKRGTEKQEGSVRSSSKSASMGSMFPKPKSKMSKTLDLPTKLNSKPASMRSMFPKPKPKMSKALEPTNSKPASMRSMFPKPKSKMR